MRQATTRRPHLHGQRGAVAVMAALCLFPMVALCSIVVAFGYLQETRQRLDAASDSVALAWANQMALLPLNRWNDQAFDSDALALRNGFNTGELVITGRSFSGVAPISQAQPDRWAPGFVSVTTTGKPPATGVGELLLAFTGNRMATALNGESSARISQVELGTFYMAKERVMFVLDYSKSMRLPFMGSGADSSLTGLDVMRSTGAQIIRDYASTVDAGILLFSDSAGNSELGEIQSSGLKPITRPSGNASNAQVDQLARTINTTGTMGEGTDIATAISSAQTMLDRAGANTQEQYSNARIILITDGEPDAGGAIDPRGDYREKVEAAEALARPAIFDAWRSGTMTDVVYMQREQSDDAIGNSAKDFLGSIAGGLDGNSKPARDSNRYYNNAGDAGAILTWLQSRPTYPTCQSRPLDDLSPVVPRYLLWNKGEVLHAYFDRGNGTEYPITNLWEGGATERAQFLSWTRAHGVAAAPGAQTFNFDLLNNADNLGAFYDTRDHTLWLSPTLCVAINALVTGGQNMRVRMRWGAPRNVDATLVSN